MKIKQKCEKIKQELIPNIIKMSDENIYTSFEKRLVDLIKIYNEICSEDSNRALSIVEKLEIHRIDFKFDYDSSDM